MERPATLGLAQLPSEIWAKITLHLSSFYILRTLCHVGNPLLLTKVLLGGVTSMRLNPSLSYEEDFKVVNRCTALSALTLEFSESCNVSFSTIIAYLPRTLVYLDVEHPNAENGWLRAASEKEMANPALYTFVTEERLPCDLGAMFPRLLHLSLKGHNWMYSQESTISSTAAWSLFFRLLPRNLQHLHMRSLRRLGVDIYPLLPPNLTYLSLGTISFDLDTPIPDSLMESLTSLEVPSSVAPGPLNLPLPPYLKSIVLRNMPQPSALPTSLTSLDLFVMYSLGDGGVESLLQHLPTGLTNLRLNIRMQETLSKTTLRTLHWQVGSSCTPILPLPRNLESLSLHYTQSEGEPAALDWTLLPPRLTQLHLAVFGSFVVSVAQLRSLPTSIVDLQLNMDAFPEHYVDVLPKTLTKFVLFAPQRPRPWSASFLRSLPPNLRVLDMHAQFYDRDFAQIPKTLTSVKLEKIVWTEYSIPTATASGPVLEFRLSPKAIFWRQADGTQSFISHEKRPPSLDPRMHPEISASYELKRIPPNIVKLDIACPGDKPFWLDRTELENPLEVIAPSNRPNVLSPYLSNNSNLTELNFAEHNLDLTGIELMKTLRTLRLPACRHRCFNQIPKSVTTFEAPLMMSLAPTLLTANLQRVWMNTTFPPDCRPKDVTFSLGCNLDLLKSLPSSIQKLELRTVLGEMIDNFPFLQLQEMLPELDTLVVAVDVSDIDLENIRERGQIKHLRTTDEFVVRLLQPSKLLDCSAECLGQEEDLHRLLIRRVESRYPFFQVPKPDCLEVSISDWPSLHPLLPTGLLSMALTHCSMFSSIGSNLTELKVGETASASMNFSSVHLPRSLTKLDIWAESFSTESYGDLPRDLTVLLLRNVGTFLLRDAQLLPPHLRSLFISNLVSSEDSMIGGLPKSISRLEILGNFEMGRNGAISLPSPLTWLLLTSVSIPWSQWLELTHTMRIGDWQVDWWDPDAEEPVSKAETKKRVWSEGDPETLLQQALQLLSDS